MVEISNIKPQLSDVFTSRQRGRSWPHLQTNNWPVRPSGGKHVDRFTVFFHKTQTSVEIWGLYLRERREDGRSEQNPLDRLDFYQIPTVPQRMTVTPTCAEHGWIIEGFECGSIASRWENSPLTWIVCLLLVHMLVTEFLFMCLSNICSSVFTPLFLLLLFSDSWQLIIKSLTFLSFFNN